MNMETELIIAVEEWNDLSEEQMENICGGGDNIVPSQPPPHTNKNGTWTPPPGDVSGNSCFFGRKRG